VIHSSHGYPLVVSRAIVADQMLAHRVELRKLHVFSHVLISVLPVLATARNFWIVLMSVLHPTPLCSGRSSALVSSRHPSATHRAPWPSIPLARSSPDIMTHM